MSLDTIEPAPLEAEASDRDMSSVASAVVAGNRLARMRRYRAAANIAVRAAEMSGNRQERLSRAISLTQNVYKSAPDEEWEEAEMMVRATFEASSGPRTSHALIRENLHQHLGRGGISKANISRAVEHTARVAKELQIPEAESPEFIRGVVDEVVDQTVENTETELTEEEGQWLKDVLSDTVDVVLDLIKGDDPDYERLIENVQRPGFLSLLRKGISHLMRCRCCCRGGSDDADEADDAGKRKVIARPTSK